MTTYIQLKKLQQLIASLALLPSSSTISKVNFARPNACLYFSKKEQLCIILRTPVKKCYEIHVFRTWLNRNTRDIQFYWYKTWVLRHRAEHPKQSYFTLQHIFDTNLMLILLQEKQNITIPSKENPGFIYFWLL